VIDIEQPRVMRRQHLAQSALALEQRPRSEILAVELQQVKRCEVRPVPAEQQVLEAAAAVRSEADDLAVEHRPP
jgi:hypothetical protein